MVKAFRLEKLGAQNRRRIKQRKIMFVFVTPTSIESGWIYFEAGFAYSKGIDVIPVGVGVDIGSIKPPLSMLQGFNITSGESLNNFVIVINKILTIVLNQSLMRRILYF